MILRAGTVSRIASVNLDRCYFLVQNLDTTLTNVIYLMQTEEPPETFVSAGITIGGMGFFEMQNCMSVKSKKQWFAYTPSSDITIKVADI